MKTCWFFNHKERLKCKQPKQKPQLIMLYKFNIDFGALLDVIIGAVSIFPGIVV